MGPAHAPEQGFKNFAAPTPELAWLRLIFLLWLRFRLLLI